MTRTKRLRANLNLLFWGRALTELKMLNAVVVLFYLHRGVGIEQVFLLSVVWSITSLVAEVPSGYLADHIGRKYTCLLGSLSLFVAWGLTWFAQGFWQFVVVYVFMSLSFAMFSGADEALLYDSLKELGREKEITKQIGRIKAAPHVLKLFLPSIGALIAKDLLEWQFKIVIGVDLTAAIISFVVLLFLIEPKHAKSVKEYEVGIYRESLETIKREPFLLKAALNNIFVFVASFVLFRAYQPFLEELGVPIIWLSVFYFLLHGLGLSGKWFAHEIEKKIPATLLISGSAILFAGSTMIAAILNVPWMVFALSLIAFTMANIRSPLFADAIHKRVESRSRATTLSNLNVLKGFIDIPLLFLAAYLAQFQIEYVYLLCGGMALFVFFFLPIRKEELAAPAFDRELDPELVS